MKAPHMSWQVAISVGKIIALILVFVLTLKIELHTIENVPTEGWVRFFLALI